MVKKIFTIGIIFISCTKNDEIHFNDKTLYPSLPNSKVNSFIKCVKFKLNRECDKEFPEFQDLQIEPFLTYDDGSSKKLTLMTEAMTKYITKETKEEFLALTIYLKEKNLVTQKLHDDMLEICLKMDSSNLVANYELAKLRIGEGYLGLSHFLIDNMNVIYPDNAEIARLKKEIVELYGEETYDKSMAYKEYLDLNPHYIEP